MSRGASESTFRGINGGKNIPGVLTEEKTIWGINARIGRKSSVNNTSLAQGHKLLFLTSIPGKSDLKNPDSEIKYIFL